MRYYSTRGKSEYATASETIIKGLAPDGGLYVPAERVTPFAPDKLPGGTYIDLANTIFKPFLTDYDEDEIKTMVQSAYSRVAFDHPEVTPLIRLSDQLHILELWHGPTSAFKDIALQLLPHLLTSALKKSGDKTEVVILTATSGDTGKSALEGFRDVPGIRIFVYYPQNGVSEVQMLQMTTQEGRNVKVAAVEGNFDDAQTGVKQIFNDHRLAVELAKAGYQLSSANSINWGRLLPQIVYYFYAYSDLVNKGAIKAGEEINFVVPTGNFGNILAGYYARQLGLPIHRLICAANNNNVLSEFINSGNYMSRRPLHLTLSPSMDILISSNLERLLFEISGHDTEHLRSLMQNLTDRGEYSINLEMFTKLQRLFWSDFANDAETLKAIATTYTDYNYLFDTHTAVGKVVLDKYLTRTSDSHHSVILSTASPFKFAGSVIQALFGRSRFDRTSELELINILARETGKPIPHNLAGLDQKPVIHEQVIARENMRDHLLSKLHLA
ncbi:MAG: threonine synthase [Dethiobacteria bacterium]|nr:threonine synthase [Dethiobacteria bacterium]